jgi:hypothetical protein
MWMGGASVSLTMGPKTTVPAPNAAADLRSYLLAYAGFRRIVFAWVLPWVLTRQTRPNKISRVLGCKIGTDLEGALAALGSFSGFAVEKAN